MKKFLMRLKYKQLGSHVHIDIFTGFGEAMPDARFSHLGLSGSLVMRADEWAAFKVYFPERNSWAAIILFEEDNSED